jgi:hypothetical protein
MKLGARASIGAASLTVELMFLIISTIGPAAGLSFFHGQELLSVPSLMVTPFTVPVDNYLALSGSGFSPSGSLVVYLTVYGVPGSPSGPDGYVCWAVINDGCPFRVALDSSGSFSLPILTIPDRNCSPPIHTCQINVYARDDANPPDAAHTAFVINARTLPTITPQTAASATAPGRKACYA